MISDFFHEAKERGFIHQCTDLEGIQNLLKNNAVTAYLGFDPTADSLHVGHLMGIMFLRLFQKCGHRPLVLMGGATAKVGDPTGKDEMRQFLCDAVLENNIEKIHPIFKKFITFGNDSSHALLLNNNDWMKNLSYIDFLRDIGRYFSINRMLTFDSVKTRLEREQNLTFLEFNYSIMQGYDFLHLYRIFNCQLQLGGSDQWGNIISGVELIRKTLGKTAYGITAPLITTRSGAKMGKTSSGAVWLNPERISAFDYWQFWRNTHDQDVIAYLKFFTDLPLDEIKRLSHLQGAELNEAKKILADECTTFIHGKESLANIHASISSLFENAELSENAALPEVVLNLENFNSFQRISLFDICVLAKLTNSKGEARRLMMGGGIRVNDQMIKEETFYTVDQFPFKISLGKKRHIMIKA